VAIIMMMAGNAVIKGVMTVGDFVMVNTYLLQLYQPLNMLGSTYRMIKTAIIDMEQMFSLMREVPEVRYYQSLSPSLLTCEISLSTDPRCDRCSATGLSRQSGN
jgi:ABC-type transport system involved in Fe-S cluster assembly fused permease/ATPase subunit